jgi:GT2 family glycosyltransferase
MTPALAPLRVVSVVIPAHNCAAHLRECLKSLRANDYPVSEVLVVDDASTDETLSVAEAEGVRCIRLEHRSGPAVARNHGARVASGDILFFLDADVCVHRDTIGKGVGTLRDDPDVVAVFGSYDNRPRQRNLLSYYKNVFHHFVHQASVEESRSFWSGCGAVRREAFLAIGGFDPAYTRPSVEDIELGARLHRAGLRVRLKKDMLATHLKKWTLWGMVRSDICDRAIPWTRLLLRERYLPNDLNLRFSQQASAVLAYLLLAAFLVGAWLEPWLALVPIAMGLGIAWLDAWSARRPVPVVFTGFAAGVGLLGGVAIGWLCWPWVLIPTGMLVGIIVLNYRLYLYFAQQHHWLFAAFVVPLHVFYYLYCGAGLLLGIATYLWGVGRLRARKNRPLTSAGVDR